MNLLYTTLCLLIASATIALAQRNKTSHSIIDMVGDAKGRIWAIGTETSASGERGRQQLMTFDPLSKSWLISQYEPVTNASPLKLATLSDGRVTCLWKSGTQSHMTHHFDTKSTAWTMIKATFRSPRLLALRAGGIAITEEGPQVVRVSGASPAPELVSLKDDLFASPETPDSSERRYAPVSAMEAGDDSLWLWTYALEPLTQLWRIRGFVRWDQNEAATVKHSPIPPDAPISAVVPDGKTYLFAAQGGKGLWRIPIAPGSATEVESGPGLLSYIEQLAFFNGTLHIITCPQPTKTRVEMSKTVKNHLELHQQFFYERGKPTGSLYRIHAGRLEEVVRGLDEEPGFGRSVRAFHTSEAGLVLGSFAGPPTFLDSKNSSTPTAARKLGREEGFQLKNVQQIVPLDSGTWLMRSDDHSWCIVSLPSKSNPKVEPRFSMLQTLQPIVQDSRHRHYAWLEHGGGVCRWEGNGWKELGRAPIAIEKSVAPIIDANDQLWLVEFFGDTAAVFSTKTDTWERFARTADAVSKRLMHGDNLIFPFHYAFSILSHQNGTRGFITPSKLFVYKNKTWHTTTMEEVCGPGSIVSGRPFFDPRGNFCISVNNSHYTFNDTLKWSQIQRADTSNDRLSLPMDNRPASDCAVPGANSKAIDHLGIQWITRRDGTLWKQFGSVAVQVGADEKVPPLPKNSMLYGVLVDPIGGAQLRLTGPSSLNSYLHVKPLRVSPPSRPVISKEANGFALHCDPTFNGWHMIKIDDLEWSQPSRESNLPLSTLLPGKHSILYRALDAELATLGQPVELEVTVEAAAKDRISQWVAELGSPELQEREDAAAALRKQGSSALPHIKATLDSTKDETHRWWLEAVIEAIEERSR